jgi:hypothetical protein
MIAFGELERTEGEAVMSCFKYHPGIRLEVLTKTAKSASIFSVPSEIRTGNE